MQKRACQLLLVGSSTPLVVLLLIEVDIKLPSHQESGDGVLGEACLPSVSTVDKEDIFESKQVKCSCTCFTLLCCSTTLSVLRSASLDKEFIMCEAILSSLGGSKGREQNVEVLNDAKMPLINTPESVVELPREALLYSFMARLRLHLSQ
jgi:hypothetical protein